MLTKSRRTNASLRTRSVFVLIAVFAFASLAPAIQAAAQPMAPPGKGQSLKTRVEALEAAVAALQSNNSLALGPFVLVEQNEINGLAGPHVIFEGANVHVRSGEGSTEEVGTLSGLGNLVVGYNESPALTDRSGAHNLVVGSEHNFSRVGGMVGGFGNTISGNFATVTGGTLNEASRRASSVSGGASNRASGTDSSVSGGLENTAAGFGSAVSGGEANTAAAFASSVTGGGDNEAKGENAWVGGGSDNEAAGNFSSVSGGRFNDATGNFASLSGEIGLEFVGGEQNVAVPDAPGGVIARSLTLDAPMDGFVIAHVSGVFKLESGPGFPAFVVCGIFIGETETPSFLADISADDEIPFAATGTAPVGAGPVDVSVICSGGAGSARIRNSQLAAIFVPIRL